MLVYRIYLLWLGMYDDSNNSSMLNQTNFCTNWLPETSINVGVYDICCSLPGLCANVLFIFVIIRNTRLRKTLTLLVVLSFANLLITLGVFAIGLTDVIRNGQKTFIAPDECFYKRPQLSFLIVGMQLQACSSFFVSLERTVAICYPYQYLKMNKSKMITIAISVSIIFVVITYCAAIVLSFKVHEHDLKVKHDSCYPSVVSGVEYGGFLYAFPALSGFVGILCYLLILTVELKRKRTTPFRRCSKLFHQSPVRRRRQIWLVKICCVFATNSFVFVVIPYTMLFVGRRTIVDDASVIPYLRRYVTFALSANSFFGVAFCFFVSAEFRNAVRKAVLCLQQDEIVNYSPKISNGTTLSSLTFRSSISSEEFTTTTSCKTSTSSEP